MAFSRFKLELFAAGLAVIVAVGFTFFLGGNIPWFGLDARGNETRYALIDISSELTASWIPTADLEPIRYTDMSPYGVNVFLDQEAEETKIRRSLELIKTAGFHFVKQQLLWSDIEQPAKGQYYDTKNHVDSWAKWDRMVDLCQEYDLEIIFRVDTSPDWARPSDTRIETPPSNYDDYGDFVYEVVSRYKGKVKFFQIWNEPNLSNEWGDKDVSATEYVKLLKIAYIRAKQANPDAVILCASLSSTLTEDAKAYNDIKFMQQMYDAGVKDYFDIATANPYGLRSGPYDRRLASDDVNFSRPVLIRQIMVRNGDAAKPIWASEMGWCALPVDFPEPPRYGRVTRDQQARYTAQALSRAQQEWPWMGVTNIWSFRTVHDVNMNQQNYFFTIVGNDFNPFPVYYAIENLAHSSPVVEYGYRQETHWALTYKGEWQSHNDSEASLGSYSQTNKPGDSLQFDFRGTELILVTKRGPTMGAIQVLIDGKPANLLESYEGQSYLDLYADQGEYQQRIPLASGLENGLHSAELIVTPTKNPAAIGNEVAIDGLIVDRKVTSLRMRAAQISASLIIVILTLGLVIIRRRTWLQKRT